MIVYITFSDVTAHECTFAYTLEQGYSLREFLGALRTPQIKSFISRGPLKKTVTLLICHSSSARQTAH